MLVKPWPWHVEVIPGVSVVRPVTNKELCQVIWGIIIIKNCMQKKIFLYCKRAAAVCLKFQVLSSLALQIGKDQEGLICLPFDAGSSVL